jgi:hypothetical protein
MSSLPPELTPMRVCERPPTVVSLLFVRIPTLLWTEAPRLLDPRVDAPSDLRDWPVVDWPVVDWLAWAPDWVLEPWA